MKYFLAFDVGTTAMKCILYDKDFNEVFVNNEEYSLLTPENNIVELTPDTYFDCFKESIAKIKAEGIDTEAVTSLTFTTQGETLIAIDDEGNALTNAIVWLDSRASSEAEFIQSEISADEFYSVTGLPGMDGALPLAKLLWIYNNKPEVYKKTHKFLLLEDYLIYKLTGKTVTEMSLQSSTGWFDIRKGCYWDKILDLCHIDKEKLPEILPCAAKVSAISKTAAADTGLSEKTVVTTGAMDQVASAVGAGNIEEGIVTETTGTALVVGATVKNPNLESEEKITVYRHFDDKFLYMPYCPTAGIVLKWYKDVLRGDLKEITKLTGKSAYSVIDEEAENAKPGSDGVLCLASFSGKDEIPDASGVFFGLTLKTGKPELSRSVLEGISCMLYEQIEKLEAAGVGVEKIYSLGGGSYSDIWCKIKASMCGVPILRTNLAQSTALGAAIFGSIAVGEYENAKAALSKIEKTEKITEPEKADSDIYKKLYKKYCALYNALKNEF